MALATGKLFDSMMERSSALVLNKRPIPIPQEYSDVVVRNISFRSRFYECKWGELRSVYIESPKIEIFNLFFFPVGEELSPVYAMEFVRMVNRMIVAVIDVAGNPSSEHSRNFAASIIRPHRERYSGILQGDDPPGWFEDCRSGNDFFVRPKDTDEMLLLQDAHYDVLEAFLSVQSDWPEQASACSLGGESTWQAGYKSHHAANSPGLPFLNRTFGEEWTQSYLHRFLFA